jgi:hypothetical protein
MAAAHGSPSLLTAPDGALRIVLHSRFPYHGFPQADFSQKTLKMKGGIKMEYLQDARLNVFCG